MNFKDLGSKGKIISGSWGILGYQRIIFRDQGSIDLLVASILYPLCFDVFRRRYIREALPKWWG